MEFNFLDDLNEDESSHEDYYIEDGDKTVSDADEISGDEMDVEEKRHELHEKVVLKARGKENFEDLPKGWIKVIQSSGMPIYIEKRTRVCTQSKPYFLGRQSAGNRQVPISAIPCLHYRRELNKERDPVEIANKMEKAIETNSTGNNSGEACIGAKSGEILPTGDASVETAQENLKENCIDQDTLHLYCQAFFDLETITVRRFKADRRERQQRIKKMNRSTNFPPGAKLLTCPLPPSLSNKYGYAEFVINIIGKTHSGILREYVQGAIKEQLRYRFQDLGDASAPYFATVVINDVDYGSGWGRSKKIAKSNAAKATLEILVPQMRSINPEYTTQGSQVFDDLLVEDPRVSKLCKKAGQLSPYQILLECVRRNYGMDDAQIQFEVQMFKQQATEFTMTFGKHIVKGVCNNKRDGKQKASQAMLQAMHSIISTWGSLLRLYEHGSRITLNKEKHEKQQVTKVRPNQLILNQLKEKMLELKRNTDLKKSIEKFDQV